MAKVEMLKDQYFRIKEGRESSNYDACYINGFQKSFKQGNGFWNKSKYRIMEGIAKGKHYLHENEIIFGRILDQEVCFKADVLEPVSKAEYSKQRLDALKGNIAKMNRKTIEGLEVGMKIPKNILNDWIISGENEYHIQNKKWRRSNAPFHNERMIESFQEIDNTLCFFVSGCHSLLFRADGFASFWEEKTQELFNEEYMRAMSSGYAMVGNIKGDVPVPTEDPIFEVGEVVEITKSSNSWNDDMNKFIGKRVKIARIIGNDKIEFKGSEHWHWSYNAGHFKKTSQLTPQSLEDNLRGIVYGSDYGTGKDVAVRQYWDAVDGVAKEQLNKALMDNVVWGHSVLCPALLNAFKIDADDLDKVSHDTKADTDRLTRGWYHEREKFDGIFSKKSESVIKNTDKLSIFTIQDNELKEAPKFNKLKLKTVRKL